MMKMNFQIYTSTNNNMEAKENTEMYLERFQAQNDQY